ncbi:hypothetical protein MMC25_004958 [Agyrium rufum]|nr:hypothetical protein [Agyrium rufum]
MSFRKRNVGISGTAGRTAAPATTDAQINAPISGVRPSPLDGRLTTSTGCQSLDCLLAGHAGLALGNSILLEETGTTDYSGTLLRYYAAEGVVQGHHVQVVGMGEQWGRDLPGLAGVVADRSGERLSSVEKSEKMKIAWRYEGLGQFGAGLEASRARVPNPIVAGRSPGGEGAPSLDLPEAFCHTFDLTKRLTIPDPSHLTFTSVRPTAKDPSGLSSVIETLSQKMRTSDPDQVHRIVIPSLLSPLLYSPECALPQHILQFLHSLRVLIRKHPTRLTAMLSLPLALYPRTSGLVRMMELLSDGVIELAPFPHTLDIPGGPSLTTSGAATAQEEKPQGMVKFHRLPILYERTGASSSATATLGDDYAFTVSRRKFLIKPFSLPPVEGDIEAQAGQGGGGGGSDQGKATKVNIDF